MTRAYALTLVALCLGLVRDAQTQQLNCANSQQLAFHCGLQFAEDSVGLPGTHWLIAGGLGIGAPGQVQGFDTTTGRVLRLYPRSGGNSKVAPFNDCPGPPDAGLSLAGVALARNAQSRHLLYVVNAGSRSAIEVFRVRLRSGMPEVTWIGCVLLPAETNPNAVAALPNRGMAIVSMDDGSGDRMAKHVAGTAYGRVFEWHADQGLRELPVPGLRGGNGIAITADGRSLLVSAWSGGELWRVARQGNVAPQRIALEFLPDNLKSTQGGDLWLVGQRPPVARIASCTGASCPTDWVLARVDATTLHVTTLQQHTGTADFNYATSAVEHAGVLYIHGRGEHRVAAIRLRDLPR